MNDPEFENELRRAQPATPSADLKSRIAAELSAPVSADVPAAGMLPRSPRLTVWKCLNRLAWAAGGAAAALAISAPWKNADSPPPAKPATAQAESIEANFEIVDRSRELIEASDEGLVFLGPADPRRGLRVSYVDRQIWTNPKTGAVVSYETPRDGVLLMPVALQ